MLRFSFPAGRIMGVDLRIHLSLLVVLLLAIGYSVAATGGAVRGFGLWLALLCAIGVRETARAIAAAYVGLKLRALFLLPMGGIMAFAPHESGPASVRAVAWSGTAANLAVGLLVLALGYGIDPRVSLVAQPWLSLAHILRSMVWMQFLLGAVNLLPAASVPSARVAGAQTADAAPAPRSKTASFVNASTGLGIALLVVGFLTTNYWPMNLWPIIMGVFLLLGSRLRSAKVMDGGNGETLLVSEVMLTEYTLLSSSDTLQGALDRTIHSLQDVFPVVRGDRLVGSVSRQTIAEHLSASGNSFLQGVMTKDLQLASPAEKLVVALRRAGSQGASEFIPVVEDGAMLGILTPQSLTRAVQSVKLARPAPVARERS